MDSVQLAQFEDSLKKRLKDGWTITSDGPSGVQIVAPRKMRLLDKIAAIVGAALVIISFPVSLVIWAVVAFDYFAMTPREREFLARPHA